MQSFRNKQDIINEFGLPTQKRQEEGVTEWLYDYGAVSSRQNFANSNSQLGRYGNYSVRNTTSESVDQFTTYNRYVKFTLNSEGDVQRWNSQGVDFTKRKNAPGATIVTIVGFIATITIVLLLAATGGSS